MKAWSDNSFFNIVKVEAECESIQEHLSTSGLRLVSESEFCESVKLQ